MCSSLEWAPWPTAPRPSSVGAPTAAVRLPSEPPPAVASPSVKPICVAKALALAKSVALDLCSSGARLKASANFEFRARKNWTESVQAALDTAHVGDAECAKIEDGFGALGDDVYACAAFDDVRVHSDAATRIVPFLDSSKLARQFVNRVDAFFWREAGVRGAAVDDELDLAHAFASCLDQALRSERGLQYENGIAAAGFGFDEFAREIATDLFVGSP